MSREICKIIRFLFKMYDNFFLIQIEPLEDQKRLDVKNQGF